LSHVFVEHVGLFKQPYPPRPFDKLRAVRLLRYQATIEDFTRLLATSTDALAGRLYFSTQPDIFSCHGSYQHIFVMGISPVLA